MILIKEKMETINVNGINTGLMFINEKIVTVDVSSKLNNINRSLQLYFINKIPDNVFGWSLHLFWVKKCYPKLFTRKAKYRYFVFSKFRRRKRILISNDTVSIKSMKQSSLLRMQYLSLRKMSPHTNHTWENKFHSVTNKFGENWR